MGQAQIHNKTFIRRESADRGPLDPWRSAAGGARVLGLSGWLHIPSHGMCNQPLRTVVRLRVRLHQGSRMGCTGAA